VSLEALNRGAGERVGRLAQGCRHVLAIQDTTELNFQRHARRTQGLGPVGNGTDGGLFLHPLLAVEAAGGRCLGLAWAKLWVRSGKIARGRRQRPTAQKESQRWQEGIAAAERVLGRPSWSRSSATAKRIFMKAGRGRGRPTCTCWRAPRKTARWSATLRCSPRATGSPSLAVTSLRCPGRPARRAKMELRFGTVELRRPRWLRRAPRLQEATPDSVMVHLVDVR